MTHEARNEMPPAMILCGGRGTRLREVTELLPKPMVAIGEQPIVWHIMKTYASFGVRRFILCLGYKGETFADYFRNLQLRTADATIRLGQREDIRFYSGLDETGWEVTLVRTGIEAATALRVERAARYLEPGDREFFLTYGDGVADVDVNALYASHCGSGQLMTVTAVHPPARFGELLMEGDTIVDFSEKPPRSNFYINGGFMVVDRAFLDRYISPGKDEYLEQTPMRRCVADRMMHAYRHEGFWQCMDTPREYALLNELWASGKAPWTRSWRA